MASTLSASDAEIDFRLAKCRLRATKRRGDADGSCHFDDELPTSIAVIDEIRKSQVEILVQ